MAKGYSVTNIPDDTLQLLQDARRRAERETGYPVPFQAYLRKLLQDAADREVALQEAAHQEYAAQQADTNNTKG